MGFVSKYQLGRVVDWCIGEEIAFEQEWMEFAVMIRSDDDRDMFRKVG
jgi:hypothetical protein